MHRLDNGHFGSASPIRMEGSDHCSGLSIYAFAGPRSCSLRMRKPERSARGGWSRHPIEQLFSIRAGTGLLWCTKEIELRPSFGRNAKGAI